MSGLGNQIIVLDLREQSLQLNASVVRAIAEGKDSFFDQMMVLTGADSENYTANITIYNRDGSEAEACGNGMRCVVGYEHDRTAKREMIFATAGRDVACRFLDDGRVEVNMGRPAFGWRDIPVSGEVENTEQVDLAIEPESLKTKLGAASLVNMGNPHAIFWIKDMDDFMLDEIGPKLEHHSLFPERANISLAQIISCCEIRLKVWERGAGITQACGSAACAVAVMGVKTGRTQRNTQVHLPGGVLEIYWDAVSDDVFMTGSYAYEYAGNLPKSPGCLQAGEG